MIQTERDYVKSLEYIIEVIAMCVIKVYSCVILLFIIAHTEDNTFKFSCEELHPGTRTRGYSAGS